MTLTNTQLAVVFGVLLLLFLWLVVRMYSVKIYRFTKSNCEPCKSSQVEWDRFKRSCMFKMIIPIDIDINNTTAEEQKLVESFDIGKHMDSLPFVVAIFDNGVRVKFLSHHRLEKYNRWADLIRRIPPDA